MRVAPWAFVVCIAVSAIGVFLPSVELEVGGVGLTRKTSLSLYQASTNRDFVRRLVSHDHRIARTRIGSAVIAAMAPKAAGRISSILSDVHDAAGTLDGVTESDAKTAGTILTVAVWAFLGLELIMIGLVFGDVVQGGVVRRRRAIAAAAVAVVVTGAAIAIHVITRKAVWEANDEIGQLVGLGAGAYAILLGAIGALVAIGGVIVQHHRAGDPGAARVAAPTGASKN